MRKDFEANKDSHSISIKSKELCKKLVEVVLTEFKDPTDEDELAMVYASATLNAIMINLHHIHHQSAVKLLNVCLEDTMDVGLDWSDKK